MVFLSGEVTVSIWAKSPPLVPPCCCWGAKGVQGNIPAAPSWTETPPVYSEVEEVVVVEEEVQDAQAIALIAVCGRET